MAFKYKLTKESELGNKKDIRRFFNLSPEMLNRMGGLVNLKAREEYVTTPANTPKSEELENIIRYSLYEEGFEDKEIDAYMEMLYIERNNNVGGEFGDTPLNEEKPKDPIQTFLNKKVQQWNAEEEKENPGYGKAKNTFKTYLKERIIKRLKESKKDMLVRASKQKP